MYCSTIVKYGESYPSPNWPFINITRPFSIIYYVIEGTAFYTIENETHSMKKNMLYIFPSNTAFSLTEDSEHKFYHLYIHAYLQPELKNIIGIDTNADNFLQQIIALIRNNVNNRNDVHMQKLTEFLISYVSELVDEHTSQLQFLLKQYLDKNFIEVFRKYNLSNVFHYSNSYLVKLFKASYGITPKQYVNQLTLKHTVSLLKNGYPISHIADILNFSSPENFSRFFKNNYGCSPSEYAKKTTVDESV